MISRVLLTDCKVFLRTTAFRVKRRLVKILCVIAVKAYFITLAALEHKYVYLDLSFLKTGVGLKDAQVRSAHWDRAPTSPYFALLNVKP